MQLQQYLYKWSFLTTIKQGERVRSAAFLTIDWLNDWCLMACQHRKVKLCQMWGREPAQSAKDGQQDTMHNTLRYAITM